MISPLPTVRKVLAVLFIVFVVSYCFAASAITVTGQMTIVGQTQSVSGSFVAPNKATNLSPVNGATHVPLAGPISWSNGGGATSYVLKQDQSNPPTTTVQTSTATTYTPSLAYNTLYYYRVDSVNGTGTTNGDVTSFTTLPTYTADLFCDFENSTSGTTLTTTILDNGSHENGTWTWTLTGTGLVSTDQQPPYTPLVVNSTTYTDLSGTRGISFDVTTQNNKARILAPVAQQTTHWSARTNIRLPDNSAGGGSNETIDMFIIESSGTGDCVFQTTSHHNELRIHSVASDGTPLLSTQLYTYTPGWYTIDMDAVNQGTYTVTLYTINSNTVLQTFTLNASTASTGVFRALRIGRDDTHPDPQPTSGTVGLDGVAVSTSGATIGP